MLEIPSGSVTNGVSFEATPGIETANFSVWSARNGAAAQVYETPTIVEDGLVGGLFHLIVDEDTTVAAGNRSEFYKLIAEHADLPGFRATFDIELVVPPPFRKNVAFAGFSFSMLSSTDHVTPTAALAVTAERSLDGAAFAACANAVVEISDGAYQIDLAAADLNGDVITFKFTAAGADPRIVTLVPSRA